MNLPFTLYSLFFALCTLPLHMFETNLKSSLDLSSKQANYTIRFSKPNLLHAFPIAHKMHTDATHTGYIYCFSNASMHGIVKVGMTERSPDIRLYEANSSDTWRPPTPYVLEFAKQVSSAKEKERLLHALLAQYTERVNPKREFFRVSPDEVRTFFDLIDGVMWRNDQKTTGTITRKKKTKCAWYEDGDYWRDEMEIDF